MFGLAPSTTEEGAEGPPSPLQELEGGARSAWNFKLYIIYILFSSIIFFIWRSFIWLMASILLTPVEGLDIVFLL